MKTYIKENCIARMKWDIYPENESKNPSIDDVQIKNMGGLIFIILLGSGWFHNEGVAIISKDGMIEVEELNEAVRNVKGGSDLYIHSLEYLADDWKDYFLHQTEPFYLD